MTIRKRLIVSYIAMILIPVILFSIIAALLMWLFFDKVPGAGGWSGGPPFMSPRKAEAFDNRVQLFAGVKFMSLYEPDRLMDSQLLKETDAALNKLQAGLVVVRDEQVIYTSPFVDHN